MRCKHWFPWPRVVSLSPKFYSSFRVLVGLVVLDDYTHNQWMGGPINDRCMFLAPHAFLVVPLPQKHQPVPPTAQVDHYAVISLPAALVTSPFNTYRGWYSTLLYSTSHPAFDSINSATYQRGICLKLFNRVKSVWPFV